MSQQFPNLMNDYDESYIPYAEEDSFSFNPSLGLPPADDEVFLGGLDSSQRPPTTSAEGEENETVEEEEQREMAPSRSVKRDLNRWQIFCIIISGTIGLGLFTDSGKVLSIAGPAGAIVAFALVGIVTVSVMTCITEMIEHWPISNALVEFVSSFVDSDLGMIVGIAYWAAYSISFATLIGAASDLAAFWSWPWVFQIIVCDFVVPFLLLLINLIGVKTYGNVEGFMGGFKLLLIGGAIILMWVLNSTGINGKRIGFQYIQDGFCNDPYVAINAPMAVIVGIPIAAYAFCGVEIVAITALEAKSPSKSLRWWPTTHIAWVLLVGYIISIFTFFLDVSWRDESLVSLPNTVRNPAAIMMIAAMNSDIPVLPDFLNACLIVLVLSSANTALYVSSRALFGLTRGMKTRSTLLTRILHAFGRTDARGVPVWALLFSVVAFAWLPVTHSLTRLNDIGLQEIMSGLATDFVILVWAAQCLAFIRYRIWLEKHQERLATEFKEFIYNESDRHITSIGRWWSTQHIYAWIGLISCLLTVLVFSTASWWTRGESDTSIIFAWLGPFGLFAAWLVKKRRKKTWWVQLDSNDWTVLRSELLRLKELVPGSKEPSRSSTSAVRTYLKPSTRPVSGIRLGSSAGGHAPSISSVSGPPYLHHPSLTGSISRGQEPRPDTPSPSQSQYQQFVPEQQSLLSDID